MAVKKHDASSTHLSIWSATPKEKFIHNVQQVLKNSQELPGVFTVYEREVLKKGSGAYQLPAELEYQLAQDLAFIAVHEESAYAVAAATVVETAAGGLLFHISANSGVKDKVRNMFNKVAETLEKCARKDISQQECDDSILTLTLDTCEQKIKSRLKYRDWVPPGYYRTSSRNQKYRPLYEDLNDVVSSPAWKYLERYHDISELSSRLRDFILFLSDLDKAPGEPTLDNKLKILRLAAQVCKMDTSVDKILASHRPCLSEVSQKKINIFDKIANYGHLSRRLASTAASKNFRHLFRSVAFQFIENYEPCIVLKQARYVHAEIQICTFHRLQRTDPLPRTIGTSKAACYLCNLFLTLEEKYTISATHGRVFSAWTIPDVLSYSKKDRQEIRRIIRNMNAKMESKLGSRTHRFIPFPVQSGIYNPASLPSLGGTSHTGAASKVSLIQTNNMQVILRRHEIVMWSSSNDHCHNGAEADEQFPVIDHNENNHRLKTSSEESDTNISSYRENEPENIVDSEQKHDLDSTNNNIGEGDCIDVEKEFRHENDIQENIKAIAVRNDANSEIYVRRIPANGFEETKKPKHKTYPKNGRVVETRLKRHPKSRTRQKRLHRYRSPELSHWRRRRIPHGKSSRRKRKHKRTRKRKRHRKKRRSSWSKKACGVVGRLRVVAHQILKGLFCRF